jgi:hypothetical protein
MCFKIKNNLKNNWYHISKHKNTAPMNITLTRLQPVDFFFTKTTLFWFFKIKELIWATRSKPGTRILDRAGSKNYDYYRHNFQLDLKHKNNKFSEINHLILIHSHFYNSTWKLKIKTRCELQWISKHILNFLFLLYCELQNWILDSI